MSRSRFLTVLALLFCLALTPLLALAAPSFSEVTGAANPFNGVDVGWNSAPTLADVDGDGDLDAFSGEGYGVINFYRNTGSATAPAFTEVTGPGNPFNGVDVGDYSAPTLADVDGDGDLDAFIGEEGGVINFYRNDGTATAPSFSEIIDAANPFNGVDVGDYSVPTLADVDGDGDLDAFIGESDNIINFYRNTGSATAPTFTEETGAANPFNGVHVGFFSAPTLADLDGDGDLDAFSGEYSGVINFYRNTGTATAPIFSLVIGAANPFDGVDVGFNSAPTLADVDGDGDLDAFSGEDDGIINFYRNGDTPVSPNLNEVTGPANPFNGVDVGGYSVPTLADVDGDGDLDAFIGEDDGVINFYRNDGTATAPSFSEITGAANPFNGVDVGFYSVPTLADVDGDGDLDAFIGEEDGVIYFYRNTGTATAPTFSAETGSANPFNGVDVGYDSVPTLADVDGDGDLDAFIGEWDGVINFYRNDGTATAPSFSAVTGFANPFDGVDVEGYSAPTLADLDGDGDLDAFIGEDGGVINFYRNALPEMAVLGNGVEITDGDAAPSTTDHTDFGNVALGQPFTRTFTISNSGTANLNLTGSPLVTITGAAAGDFSLVSNPATPVAAGSATTFQVRFTPSALGARAATVTIANNDSDENPYDFAIQGSGTCPSTVTVQNANNSGAGSLRQAIADVCSGGTIDFAGDTAIYLNSQLDINKTVTIDGESHAVTVSGDSGHNGSPNVRVFNIGSSGVATLTHLSIVSGTVTGGSSCPTYCGGGISNGGTLTVMNSTLSGNSASSTGGGVYIANGSRLTVLNSTLSGNSAQSGGGIYIDSSGTLTVTNSTLSGNSATWEGGGIYINSSGTLTLINSTLSGNSTSLGGGGGGGIVNTTSGTLTMTNSTLSGNSAPNGSGGGVSNDGTLSMLNSTLSNNSAGNYGGGIIITSNGTLTMTNSTLSGNSAGGGYGGGIRSYSGSTLTVQNSTLSGNSATSGGGIYNGGTLNLTNTIIANSPSGSDCRGSVTTNDHNLIEATGTNACGLANGAGGSLIGFDPLLGTLGNYGGDTMTLPLLPGSPAINAGNNATCQAADQRGIARPQPGGGVCDIGAFESRGFTLTLGGGSGQSTLINTAFTNPLTLTVSSGYAEPVNDGQVVFTGPGSGAGTNPRVYTATIAAGAASQVITANGTAGSYVVTATTRGSLGSALSYNLTNLVPEIAVQGNGVTIADGDTIPTAADHTDFGSLAADGAITRTFTISNSGAGNLTVGAINFTGAAPGDFSVVTPPATPVGPNFTTTFDVRFTPSALGARTATVSIANNDSNENPYDFAIQGTGLCANTITVQNANDSGAGSLRQAIANVCNGGLINFANNYTIYLSTSLTITTRLTIDGETNAVAVSGDSGGDGSPNVRPFYIQNTGVVTLNHLSIVSGTTPTGVGCPSNCGGGIVNRGALTLVNSTLAGNSSTSGGGIYSLNGTLTVSNSTFSGNWVIGLGSIGGGIENNGTLTVYNSVFSGNSGPDGGGIRNGSTRTMTVTNCIFSGNSNGASGGYGAGIHNLGTATVSNSAFFNNSAGSNSGGGGINNRGTLTVVNSAFSGNSAIQGGGIRNELGGALTVINSTLSANSAASMGGGLHNLAGTLRLTNTLIANSPSGGDCVGSVTTNANNLIEGNGNACGLTNGANGNIIGVDPLLAPLGDYGGPSVGSGPAPQTFALLPGSPAIDAGNSTVCAASPVNNLDQRGITRPVGSVCDIGAFESRGFNLAYGSGSGQSAFLNTAFTNPLTLTVTSSFTEPVDGGQVTFTGPGSGASTQPAVYIAAISGGPSAGSGIATQVVTANNTGGSYVVTGTARGNLGGPINYTLTNLAPEMAVLGNGVTITDGDTTPAAGDHTDFGSVTMGEAITRTFTISNSGALNLSISSFSLSGAAAADFTLSGPTTPTTVAPNTTVTFDARFTPTLLGARVATVTIANNDSNENPYDFAIRGTGTLPTVSLSVSANSGTEAAQTVITATATASTTVVGNQTVNLGVTGTGITAEDYSLSSSTITILDGQSSGYVTFTIQDDAVDEATETASLTLSSPSAGLSLGSPLSQNVTITDNDTRNVTVTPSGGTTTVTEGGTTDTYTLVLTSEPTATVTLAVNSGTQTEVRTGAGAYGSSLNLTFTTANWATPQTVEVRAVDDTTVEGNHSQAISHSASGGDYTGLSIANITADIIDNDIRYTLAAPGDVTEGNVGVQTTAFTVTRTGDITRSSTVNFGLSGTAGNGTDYTNVTPAPGTLTFAAGVTQEIIALDVVGDYVDESNEVITLTLSSATGTGGGGSGAVSGSPADVLIVDDDSANIAVSPTSLTVSEPDTTAVFTITLDSQPTADVTINLSSSDTTECTVPATVVLTAANWQTGVGVTVTAVDDAASDGAQPCTVQTGAASSSDANYNGRSVADVSVTVNDDEVPGVILSKTSASVGEGGPNDTYTVRLQTVPTGTVTVSFNTGGQLQAIAGLTFAADATALNPQTVTVQAVDDTTVEGNHSQAITHSASGGGYNSAPFTPGNSVTVAITDNDIRYTLAAPGDVTEGNVGVQTTAFTVTRTGDITRSSTVNFGLSGTAGNGTDYTNVTPAPGTLTFAPGVTQEIIALDVVGDYVDESNEVITLTLSSAGGTGGGGTGTVSGSPADVVIQDNDTANIALSPTSLTVSEPNTTGVFTLSLTSQPTAAVSVTLMVSDLSECTLSQSSAALDAANWQTGVTVTVTALDDAEADGPQSCHVVTNAASSADPDYDGQNPANVTVTVNDDDTPEIEVSPLNLTVAEPAGTAVFTISLATPPTGSAAVTVPLTSTCAAVPAGVTIPYAAWASGVTVTVTALDDEIDNEPERTCAVVTGDPTSPAAEYEALAAGDVADVSVTVTDDDTADFIFWPPSGETSEDGGVFTFTLRLNSEPIGNVVIDVTSSNPAAGAASPTQLTFTPLNWGQVQTITVTGLDDGDNPEGDASYSVQLAANGSTADPAYAAIDPVEVTVANRDNDVSPLYLPLILNGFTPAPDLVIDSLASDAGGPQVVIRNAGTTAVTDAFWVDVYFDPNPAPPPLNRPWPSIAPYGAHWGVTQALAPGESLALTIGGPYYAGGSSSFPAGAQVYAYVDSINYSTTYGNVRESNESNNVAGPELSTTGQAQAAVSDAGPQPDLSALPSRGE